MNISMFILKQQEILQFLRNFSQEVSEGKPTANSPQSTAKTKSSSVIGSPSSVSDKKKLAETIHVLVDLGLNIRSVDWLMRLSIGHDSCKDPEQSRRATGQIDSHR